MLKEGTRAIVEKDSYPVLPIFKLLAKEGDIEEKMMYNTYNMGLGMILAVRPEDVDRQWKQFVRRRYSICGRPH